MHRNFQFCDFARKMWSEWNQSVRMVCWNTHGIFFIRFSCIRFRCLFVPMFYYSNFHLIETFCRRCFFLLFASSIGIDSVIMSLDAQILLRQYVVCISTQVNICSLLFTLSLQVQIKNQQLTVFLLCPTNGGRRRKKKPAFVWTRLTWASSRVSQYASIVDIQSALCTSGSRLMLQRMSTTNLNSHLTQSATWSNVLCITNKNCERSH